MAFGDKALRDPTLRALMGVDEIEQLRAERDYFRDAVLRAEWEGGNGMQWCPWCSVQQDEAHDPACPVTKARTPAPPREE